MLYDVVNHSLFVSDGSTWDVVYTKDEWQTYYQSYRPVSAYHGGNLSKGTDDWDATIQDEDKTPPSAMTAAIGTPSFTTPSGQARVTLQSYGKNTATSMAGHLSFEIHKATGGATVGGANAYGRGPSFYTTNWGTGSMTMIVGSIPVNEPCKGYVYFNRTSAASGQRAWFNRIRLTIEPIL